MVDEKKQVNEITKMLMDVPGAVTYQTNAYKLYADNPYEHKFIVSSNNVELTIDYNKLANAVHKYNYIKNREIVKVPLDDVAGKLKMVDPKSGIIKEAKMLGICFGD